MNEKSVVADTQYSAHDHSCYGLIKRTAKATWTNRLGVVRGRECAPLLSTGFDSSTFAIPNHSVTVCGLCGRCFGVVGDLANHKYQAATA
jgi:hypothetical protein